MKNPWDAIEDKIEDIKREVERRVQIAILRETAKVTLSRLSTLDTEHSLDYQAAMQAMQ